MNVLVLQSFLVVSAVSQSVFKLYLNVSILGCINETLELYLTVSLNLSIWMDSLPIFELYDELPDDEHCFNLLHDCEGGRLPTACLLPLFILYAVSAMYHQS